MQLLLFSVQEKMETLERLVFDVDAAVTEFTRKGTIGNRTVGRAGDKRDILSEPCKISNAVFQTMSRKSSPCTVRLQ